MFVDVIQVTMGADFIESVYLRCGSPLFLFIDELVEHFDEIYYVTPCKMG
jgi:hypothetical protein